MASFKRHLRVIQIVSLVAGLILFAYLVSSVGIFRIADSIRLVGFGFVILIIVSGLRHLTRTLAWFYCIEADYRRIKIFELFNVRLAGEAVRYLSFTGPILGETSKAVLIRKRLPMTHGMSSLITENLTYSLGAVFLIITGLILLAANFAVKDSVKILSLALSVSMIVLVLAANFVISRRRMILTGAIKRLGKLTGAHWFRAKASSVEKMERLIHDFYKRRQRSFYLVLFLEIAAQFLNVFEVYLILYYIGASPTLMAAYIVETTMKIVNSLFFFVPGQIGVMEGGNALILKALGMGIAAGVTLSLIEKIRTLFWAAYGLCVWMIVFRRRQKSDSENNIIPEDLNDAGEMAARQTMQ
jgi:glycosyltransferase 2 family protein